MCRVGQERKKRGGRRWRRRKRGMGRHVPGQRTCWVATDMSHTRTTLSQDQDQTRDTQIKVSEYQTLVKRYITRRGLPSSW